MYEFYKAVFSTKTKTNSYFIQLVEFKIRNSNSKLHKEPVRIAFHQLQIVLIHQLHHQEYFPRT